MAGARRRPPAPVAAPAATFAALALVAALLPDGGSAQVVAIPDDSCPAIPGVPPQEAPISGTYPAAIVFGAMSVSLTRVHPPTAGKEITQMSLAGVCDPANFPSNAFQMIPPANGKGEWITQLIAPVGTSKSSISVNGETCPLTAVALTTDGFPTLRLQFDNCARKTAVTVPLKPAEGGTNLVSWVCKVSEPQGSNSPCEGLGVNIPSGNVGLDLSKLLSEDAANTVTMFQVNPTLVGCFESFDWYMVDTPMIVERSEWNNLLRIREALSTGVQPRPMAPALATVNRVCAESCQGTMAGECRHLTASCVDCWPRILLPLLIIIPLAFICGFLCCCWVPNKLFPPPMMDIGVNGVDVVQSNGDNMGTSSFGGMRSGFGGNMGTSSNGRNMGTGMFTGSRGNMVTAIR